MWGLRRMIFSRSALAEPLCTGLARPLPLHHRTAHCTAPCRSHHRNPRAKHPWSGGMDGGDLEHGSGWPDVWGSAVASGDAVKLSQLVLEWSASKPEEALSLLRRCVALMERDLAQCVVLPASSPSPTPSQSPAQAPCLTALVVALDQTCAANGWYASTKELQLASLDFCAACRGVTTLTLRVDEDIPRRLLAAADAPPPNRKRLFSTRVPRPRALRVRWRLPTAAELRRSIYSLDDAHEMEFDCDFVGTLGGVVWPRGLKTVEVDCRPRSAYHLLTGVAWPESLRQLTFGDDFNQPIQGLALPASLEQLTFGYCFDQSIERIRWPTSLRRLVFVHDFNQPIEGVRWPDSITHCRFGFSFDQPVEDVKWPASLEQLTFGFGFDQPIERALWPVSLQQLTFKGWFNQPIHGVTWPQSIRHLSFGHAFNQPVDRVRWPTSLQSLSFGTLSNSFMRVRGVRMDSDFSQHMVGAKWPVSMRRLTLGSGFLCTCRGLGCWMPNLEELTVLLRDRAAYDDFLWGINLPSGLQKLTMFKDASLDGVVLPKTVTVHRLVRGI